MITGRTESEFAPKITSPTIQYIAHLHEYYYNIIRTVNRNTTNRVGSQLFSMSLYSRVWYACTPPDDTHTRFIRVKINHTIWVIRKIYSIDRKCITVYSHKGADSNRKKKKTLSKYFNKLLLYMLVNHKRIAADFHFFYPPHPATSLFIRYY